MPLLWLSLCFLAGIGLGAALRTPYWLWAGLGILFIGLIFIERRLPGHITMGYRRIAPLPLSLLLAAVCVGALRLGLAQPSLDAGDLAYYNDGEKVELSGWVAGDPDRREKTVQLKVRVERLQVKGQEPRAVKGTALMVVAAGGEWAYGDEVQLYGELRTPAENEDFSYRDYLANRNIYSQMFYPWVEKTGERAGNPVLRLAYRLRAAAYRTINRQYAQPEAALLSGILLGLERDLPEDLERAFQQTGTAHIIAISGFNMAVLSGLFVLIFRRFLPRLWAALAAVLAITFYTLLVGANPAVVRAALMGGLAVFGGLIGRSSANLTPLGFTAALMCLFNPRLPWDASFQLSFTATLGLVLYGGRLQSGFEAWAAQRWGEKTAHGIAGPVGEYVLFTLAAQAATLPVVLGHFERLSLSALLANPLILPVQPLVMILSGIAVIAGMLVPALGQGLAWLSWPLSAYTIQVVRLLARLPWGSLYAASFGLGGVALYYAVFIGLAVPGTRAAGLRKRLTPAVGLVMLALLAVLLWSAALRRPDGRLHLLALDEKGTQALLVTTPGGSRILIGGGESANTLGSAVGEWLGPLRRRVDALVIPESSTASLAGLPALLERFQAGQVVWAVAAEGTRAVERVDLTAEKGGAPLLDLASGQALQLDEGVTLTRLDKGGESAALLLGYAGLRVLWAGDWGVDSAKAAGINPQGLWLVLGEDNCSEEAIQSWQDAGIAGLLPLGACGDGGELAWGEIR